LLNILQRLHRTITAELRAHASILGGGATAEEIALEAAFNEALQEPIEATYQLPIDEGLVDEDGDRDELIIWILALFASNAPATDILRAVLFTFMVQAYNLGGQIALDTVGIDETFNLTNEDILADIEQRAIDLVDPENDPNLLNTTARDLAIQVAAGRAAGLTANEVSENLALYIAGRALTRSTAISGNESVRASRAALIEVFVRVGIERVQFKTQEDDRVCQICRPINNQIFIVGEGPEIPDDLHGECRCYYIPAPDEVAEEVWTGE